MYLSVCCYIIMFMCREFSSLSSCVGCSAIDSSFPSNSLGLDRFPEVTTPRHLNYRCSFSAEREQLIQTLSKTTKAHISVNKITFKRTRSLSNAVCFKHVKYLNTNSKYRHFLCYYALSYCMHILYTLWSIKT